MFNQMQLIGNVGSEPEMRYTPNGNPVTSFSVATNYKYTPSDGGDPVEHTEWFKVSCWGKLAEVTNQHVHKGMQVFVQGRLQSRPWLMNDGKPAAGNEINAVEVRFLSRKASDEVDESPVVV